MPSDQQLKRKESDAELFPSPSPKKKQASSALDLPSTKILHKSGERSWRAQGVETRELKKGFELFRNTDGRRGLSYSKDDINRDYIEKKRLSEPFWEVFLHSKFAQQYRRTAERFRDKANLEDDKAGGRSTYNFAFLFLILHVHISYFSVC